MSQELLDSLDNFAATRSALRALAEENDEWAGIPMPIQGKQLVVEPSYPYAVALKPDEAETEEKGYRVRNQFWSSRYRRKVIVFEKDDGCVSWCFDPDANDRISLELHTAGCAVWGIEQEANALNLLGTLVSHHKFKSYLLAGIFLETSKRSGVTYCFRKLRPTIAIKACEKDQMIFLAALCMHPIGYYSDTWAGAMCPTDDVIAHLMLMRGDEHMFWKRCSQHPCMATGSRIIGVCIW